MHKNTKTLLYILYLLIALPLSGAVFGLGLRVWAPVDWVDCAFYTLSLGLGGVLFALRKERAREAFFEHRGRAGIEMGCWFALPIQLLFIGCWWLLWAQLSRLF